MQTSNKHHKLKCQQQYFIESWADAKRFEIRANDRKFAVGDSVALCEVSDTDNDYYTGRIITGVITYVSDYLQRPHVVVFCYDVECKLNGGNHD